LPCPIIEGVGKKAKFGKTLLEGHMLNLNELTVFLAAVRCGSFSEAGRQLHISQPAISQNIDSLEKRFGVKLFVRQGRCVKLTEAGQLLQPLAAELMASASRVNETMCSLQGEVVGEMSVGCSTASGKYLLPGLLARFRRDFPNVRINVTVTGLDVVIQKILAGDMQLGVTSKCIEHSDLEYQSFFEDEIIMIAPIDHKWARYRHIYPDDVLDEPIILREDGAGTRSEVWDGLRKHEILPDMLKVAMVLGNAEAIVMAVEEGIGVAFVSRLAALRSLDLGRIVHVCVEGMELNHTIQMVRNRRFISTRALSEFWSFSKLVAPGLYPCSPPTLS
jgi:LysR family transcriptional regulator, transcriptional activator of the cysJI operon